MGQLSIPAANGWLEVREWPDRSPGEKQSWMDRLYDKLDGSYPNVWRANFRDPMAIKNWAETWAETFDDEGLSPRDIGNGIKACRRLYDMPPSLPQFLKACRPDVSMGIEAQFHRAVSEMTKRRRHAPQTWPAPGLFWAAAHLGADLLTLDYRALSGRWTAALSEHGSRTDPIPDVEAERALPAPSVAMSRNDATQRVAQLRGSSIGRSTGGLSNWLKIAEETERGVYVGGLYSKCVAAEVLHNAGQCPAHMIQFLPKNKQEAA